jgi:hypothetical protein
MAYLVYKHNSYHAIFSKSGKKHWIKIGNVDKKQAKQVLKQLELEFAKDRLNLNQTKTITLFDFIGKYLEYAQANSLQSNGLQSYYKGYCHSRQGTMAD